MANIEVEIKLEKKLKYELTRIKKEISTVRKINRNLKTQNIKLLGESQRLKNIIVEKNKAIGELKLRIKTYLGSVKKPTEILVEITSEQARNLFVYSDVNEVFLLHSDNSESLLGENNFNDYEDIFWANNRFAIEAKTIPEKN